MTNAGRKAQSGILFGMLSARFLSRVCGIGMTSVGIKNSEWEKTSERRRTMGHAINSAVHGSKKALAQMSHT